MRRSRSSLSFIKKNSESHSFFVKVCINTPVPLQTGLCLFAALADFGYFHKNTMHRPEFKVKNSGHFCWCGYNYGYKITPTDNCRGIFGGA